MTMFLVDPKCPFHCNQAHTRWCGQMEGEHGEGGKEKEKRVGRENGFQGRLFAIKKGGRITGSIIVYCEWTA